MVWGWPGARMWGASSWLSFLSFSPCFPRLLLSWDPTVVWIWARVELYAYNDARPLLHLHLSSSPPLSRTWLFSQLALPMMESALPRRLVPIFPD